MKMKENSKKEEAATTVTNATTGMLHHKRDQYLNATGLEDENEDSEDEPRTKSFLD